jgi:S-adenosylmethionine hydrolase
MLDNFIKDKKFRIYIKDKTIEKVSHSYTEGVYLKPLALIDSFNYLEIALNRGSACDYLKAKKGTKVIVSVT